MPNEYYFALWCQVLRKQPITREQSLDCSVGKEIEGRPKECVLHHSSGTAPERKYIPARIISRDPRCYLLSHSYLLPTVFTVLLSHYELGWWGVGRDGGDEQILYRVSQTGHALLCRSSCCIFLYKTPALLVFPPIHPASQETSQD